MYPSYDLNPIAFEHWQRERLAADIAQVDAMSARTAQLHRGMIIALFLGVFRRRPDAARKSARSSTE